MHAFGTSLDWPPVSSDHQVRQRAASAAKLLHCSYPSVSILLSDPIVVLISKSDGEINYSLHPQSYQWCLYIMIAFFFCVFQMFSIADLLPQSIRQKLMQPPLTDQHPDIIVTEDTMDGIPVIIYRPKHVSGTLPAVLYIHGGGWMYGSICKSFRWIF